MLILAFMKDNIRNYSSWIWRLVHPLLEQVLTFVFSQIIIACHKCEQRHRSSICPAIFCLVDLLLKYWKLMCLCWRTGVQVCLLTLEASLCACMQVSGAIQFAGLIIIFQTRLISFISCMDVIGNKYYLLQVYIFEFKTDTLMLLMCNKKWLLKLVFGGFYIS